jgi:hypothetical protein
MCLNRKEQGADVVYGELIVESGWHERVWCPVQCRVELPEGGALEELRLRDKATGASVPLQAWPVEEGQVGLAWMVEAMDWRGQRSYELVTAGEIRTPVVKGVVLSEEAPGELNVSIEGELFTRYHFGPEVVRPYLYPVLASGGRGITRNWPMVPDVPGETHDHPHHKGLYTAHGEVNGTNNWAETPGHSTMIHRGFARLYSGPVAGGFTQELDWADPAGSRVLTETRRALFYSTPPQARLFDWEVTLHASEGEVVLGDTKEGGLISVRVATSMDAGGKGRIENGYGGRQETETWGKRAPWCDYSGPLEGAWSGICMMDHVDNPRHPTYWHVRNYGLMTANCFGIHDFTGDPENRHDMVIPAGESRTWRYRVLVHEGDAGEGQAAVHYHDYVHPPLVRMLPA